MRDQFDKAAKNRAGPALNDFPDLKTVGAESKQKIIVGGACHNPPIKGVCRDTPKTRGGAANEDALIKGPGELPRF